MSGKSTNNKGNNLVLKIMIIVASVVAVALAVVVVLYANSLKNTKSAEDAGKSSVSKEDDLDGSGEVVEEVSRDGNEAAASNNRVEEIETLGRPILIKEDGSEDELRAIVPNVPEYNIEAGLANVINGEYFSTKTELVDALVTDGFAVSNKSWAREFFDIYESNRYAQLPSFVTVDSLMHTYHLYFAYMLKKIEKEHLYDELSIITNSMLDASYDQYINSEGEWKEAAKRNMAFFSVGKVLLDSKTTFPEEVSDIVNQEYSNIMKAEGISKSPVREDDEDYTQYKPRGYYEGDEILEKYFRAMMWYGRIQLDQKDESMDRSSLLMTLAMKETCIEEWETIYTITSFFAGASDDLGYYEYWPAIENIYGKEAKFEDIQKDDNKFDEFHALTASLRAPRINSIPIEIGEENVILGYRFMGQRFSIDATIMQNLIFSNVGTSENPRMLPDVLDVPAALGSDVAYKILADAGITKYDNYDNNMTALREEFNNEDSDLWNASLYANWLNTLRPLLEEKGKGYPLFMQNDKWSIKDLETFAGSYTELKHDTVLYSKQPMAEMGGDWEEDIDDRGYVEPEVIVYYRFTRLTNTMSETLQKYGYASKEDVENLSRLANISETLMNISIKELNDEVLTDDEYEFIRAYGGETEHFWSEAMRDQSDEQYMTSEMFPAALVVDIATDPNGQVLEAATGNPNRIYVVVPVEGKLRVAIGAVYNFYEFAQPIDERLTDKEWQKMLGIIIEDYNDYYKDIVDVENPDWVMSYRIED